MRNIRSLSRLPESSIFSTMNSQAGELTIVASDKGIHAILWSIDLKHPNTKKAFGLLAKSDNDKLILKTKKQLQEYFDGKRRTFDLPLVMEGTDFQVKVWKQLLKIPYAKTLSYGEQAEKIGDKKKARAVGMANGLNPISIVVPCHRVVGSGGHLTGFAGGLDTKAYLLSLEQKN